MAITPQGDAETLPLIVYDHNEHNACFSLSLSLSDIVLIYSVTEKYKSFSECLSLKDGEMMSTHFKVPVGKVLAVGGNEIHCRKKAEITKSVGKKVWQAEDCGWKKVSLW